MIVVWAEEAKTSFQQNVNYLQENWDENVIEHFLDAVEHTTQLIESNPKLFPFYKKRKGVRKALVVKQVALFYRIKANHIELLLFWNNYQNPKRLKL